MVTLKNGTLKSEEVVTPNVPPCEEIRANIQI